MKKLCIWSSTLLLTLFSNISSAQNTSSVAVEDLTAEMAVSFNQRIIEYAIAEDRLLTLKGVRSAAIMHCAMHDALNAIHPKYTHYAYGKKAPGANPVVAAAQAGYEIAVSQYPDHKQEFMEELNRWLTAASEGASKMEGIRLGKEAAAAILNARSDDRWDGEAEYVWHPMGPGVYAEFNEHSGTPEGFVFGAGWAVAKPFLLTKPDHFRSPPPPDIKSQDYTEAFNEVREYGRTESKSRTADQAHLAMWWKDFAESSHNRLTREIVIAENLDLWEATRVFALMNMSIYDAYVCVFENKFHYNHWRPYTAIRWAEHDGNPSTTQELDWNNLHLHTYAFPSYPSAHGTSSSAAMTILANTLGLGDDYAFTMTAEEVDKAGPFSEKIRMNPPTRSFSSFSEATFECAMSRLYLGIHFRYDSEEGNKLGTQIGEYASANFLKPLE